MHVLLWGGGRGSTSEEQETQEFRLGHRGEELSLQLLGWMDMAGGAAPGNLSSVMG